MLRICSRALLTDVQMTEDYYSNRKSLVILSNTSCLLPRMDFRDTKGQIRCAAELIASSLDVKKMIDNETLPVNYMRGKPLCMNQYKTLMSGCRIPGLTRDSEEFYTHKHITVVRNCQFFSLDVYNSDGTPLTVDQLCVQLERICKSSLQTNMEPVGIFTTWGRNKWSKTYINLIKDETNKESLLAIQSSIFTVCLDGAMPADEIYLRRAGVQVLHGGGSWWNSGNRWFDKSLQVIIGEDGTCGVNNTHSAADGTTMMDFCSHLVEGIKKPQVTQSPMEPLPVPKKLHFSISHDIQKDIEEAKEHLDKLVRDTDLVVTTFNHFGKNFLKAHKISPNGFFQMARLLAYYRMHQQFIPMDEAVTLRMFRLGRICAANPTSPAAVAFVKAFDDPQKQNSEKVDLLKKALKAYTWYINMSMNGQNIETHLVGLYWHAIEENIPLPGIFTDPSYNKAFLYECVSSQIQSLSGIRGIGSAEQRGWVGVNYSICDDHIELCGSSVDTYNNSIKVKAGAMTQAVEGALLDMKILIEQTP